MGLQYCGVPFTLIINLGDDRVEFQYEMSEFPETSIFGDVTGTINLNWGELFHGAITVGRKSWEDVYYHPFYSEQEVYFRYFMMRTFIKNHNEKIYISEAYKTLDPSEKGAINYFIGCTFTKIIAEKLFETSWLMHLDVYQRRLYGNEDLRVAYYGNDNSRPDFIGVNYSKNFNVFESKGRVKFYSTVLDKAKAQCNNVKTINGKCPEWKIACLTFHNEENFKMIVKDPQKYGKNAIDLKIDLDDFFLDYYALIFNFIHRSKYNLIKIKNLDFYLTNDKCENFSIGMEKGLFDLIKETRYNRETFLKRFKGIFPSFKTLKFQAQNFNKNSKNIYIGGDGIFVKVHDVY